MTTITIFGNGNMGQAISGVLARGGADIQHIGSADTAAVVNGDIVVLAVPYAALAQIAAAYGPQLAGKTVVDLTNPLDFSTFDALVVPAGSSAAAELQSSLPEAKVVKAFNTNFAATLVSGREGDATTTVLVAGDDADAKAGLIAAITAGGLAAVDAGALARAHELESIGFLQLTLAVGEQIGWTGGLALVR
ncbi:MULTISPECIES: NADPH-dependent F420 reductase [Microbacterium]|uniref:NADP oxidoreductase coenzyme F420-dependent n=1 Tax=Microbacterium trichothecenolyticum TaxID=69370 RepID=A0A0M2HI27_MICTR|nr:MULTISPECIES: NADPH-dependent F420 reductase [Microbacterium]KJL44425.1 NADP oxidoreductase coenzyme F420-dependent [Microbacterium trichothecenolyticum]MDR7188781.1 putative dinucleotide-binding enzyme [Microbacterium sp. BE35]